MCPRVGEREGGGHEEVTKSSVQPCLPGPGGGRHNGRAVEGGGGGSSLGFSVHGPFWYILLVLGPVNWADKETLKILIQIDPVGSFFFTSLASGLGKRGLKPLF